MAVDLLLLGFGGVVRHLCKRAESVDIRQWTGLQRQHKYTVERFFKEQFLTGVPKIFHCSACTYFLFFIFFTMLYSAFVSCDLQQNRSLFSILQNHKTIKNTARHLICSMTMYNNKVQKEMCRQNLCYGPNKDFKCF